MSTGQRVAIPTTTIGAKGPDPYPCLENLWSFYSKKGTRTVFISVGASTSCLADLELSESLGCPIHIVPITQAAREGWEEVAEIVKARARPETAQHAFSMGAEDVWILPNNIRFQTALPWWGEGQFQGLPTAHWFPWVSAICSDMKLANDDVRLDILKVDLPDGLERGLLMSMLDAGFRPGCILVNWEAAPDTHIPTSMAAGHLQNAGYALVGKVGKKFVYYFVDQDMYMTCSWESTETPNPMIQEIVRLVKKSQAPSEGPNSHARRPGSHAVPPSTEAAPSSQL